MAVDEAILGSVSRGESPPTLRLYEWSPGCYSVGRFQRAADLNDEARREPGGSWVRRPSGGRALYHGPELTYSVIAPLSDGRVSGTVLESYRKIAGALVAGLHELGVEVGLAPGGDPVRMRANPSCFDNPSAYELLLDGRKLVGSAQLRHGGALLQHGSIPLDDPTDELFGGLRFDTEEERVEARERGRERLATLSEALGEAPDVGIVCAAVVNGFMSAWGVEFSFGDLTEREEAEAARLEVQKYSCCEWNYLK